MLEEEESDTGQQVMEGAEDYQERFDFDNRHAFEADGELARTRSSKFKRIHKPKKFEAWNRLAPDLRMQLYHPHPVPRNSREAIQPWKYKASFDYVESSHKPQEQKPKVMPSMQEMLFGKKSSERAKMIHSTHVLRPYEAKLLFVKMGKLPHTPYTGLQPHDFRAYPSLKSLGLPEFETAYERDPKSLRFKTQKLDQVHVGPLVSIRDETSGKQLGDVILKQPPKWQRHLHLPKSPYPHRDKQTTRHRPLYRSPHSAFLTRVETKLSKEWEQARISVKTAPTQKSY